MYRVPVFNTHRTRRVKVNTAAAYVRRVLRLSKVKRALVSVVFVDSRYCRKINKRYLRRDYVTDVISFPLESGNVLEGEVYVNLDRARTQAREYDVSFSNEVARLIIHGTLHLVGHDDSTPRHAKLMKAEEDCHMKFWFE